MPASPDFISEIDGIRSLVRNNATVDYFPGLVPNPSTEETGFVNFTGEYYRTPDLTGSPVATRVDPLLNFGPFNASNLPAADPPIVPPFSGIWTGTITPRISGDHVFKVSTGGTIQLFVNGRRSSIAFHLSARRKRRPPPPAPLCRYPPRSRCKQEFLLRLSSAQRIIGTVRLFNLPFTSVTGLQASWAPLQPPDNPRWL